MGDLQYESTPDPNPLFTVFDDYRQCSTTKTVGVYAQDQATLVQDRAGVHKLIAVAGLRYDAYRQKTQNGGLLFGNPVANAVTAEEALSPRLGLVWMPLQTVSLYGSYSRSIQPQEIAALASSPPGPQKGEQYEAGVKLDVAPKASITASVFEITKQNVPSATNVPGVSVVTGEQRSRGFELEAAAETLTADLRWLRLY